MVSICFPNFPGWLLLTFWVVDCVLLLLLDLLALGGLRHDLALQLGLLLFERQLLLGGRLLGLAILIHISRALLDHGLVILIALIANHIIFLHVCHAKSITIASQQLSVKLLAISF